jgi:DNA-binding MarR family transcriptional regulator
MSKQFSEIVRDWNEVFMRHSFRDFKHFMDAEDLSPSQVNTLMRLYHGGTSDVSNIGELAGVTNAAASQLVERLVQTGLVERKESDADRRVKILTLTEKGKQLVRRGFAARQKWMEELTHAFTTAQQDDIAKALIMLTDAARKLETGKNDPVNLHKDCH